MIYSILFWISFFSERLLLELLWESEQDGIAIRFSENSIFFYCNRFDTLHFRKVILFMFLVSVTDYSLRAKISRASIRPMMSLGPGARVTLK